MFFERLHQPIRQVVAVAFHQIGHHDLVTLLQPVFLSFGQRAHQKISRAIKALNRQATFSGATAAGCEVVKQQFFAQNRVDGLGNSGALSRAQSLVVTEKTLHSRVRRIVKFKGEPDELRTGVKQGFRMHKL